MNFEELGEKTYHEWAQASKYSINKNTLLNATKEELKLFREGFIVERMVTIGETIEDCEEAFCAMLDEIQVATEISL